MAKLYPPIKPYKKGYLKVSDGYRLYYELCGNPKGIPVLYLHGGPGAGISPKDRRYFNPKKFNAILFDQRGAGKSKPFASTKANTTWKIVDDINALLDYLNIKKVLLFGGSWGSTLALVYAINNPKRVSGMLLRGIYTATEEEDKNFFGGTAAKMFPDAWERFINNVPKGKRKNFLDYYINQMNSKNKKIADGFARWWALYELTMIGITVTQKKIKKYLKRGTYKALAKLESHYFKHRCFLPKNYIIRNAGKLAGMPVVIVHGRYDTICLPVSAYRLHKLLPKSKLYFTVSGHHPIDIIMQEKLVEEMDKFSKKK